VLLRIPPDRMQPLTLYSATESILLLNGFPFAADFPISICFRLNKQRQHQLCDATFCGGFCCCLFRTLSMLCHLQVSSSLQHCKPLIFDVTVEQAYMIIDFSMFLLPFTPNDFLFVGHHLMTIGYMMSSLYINRGGLSCLILMVLGESTSLFQNSWLISRELRRESKVCISGYLFDSHLCIVCRRHHGCCRVLHAL